MATNYLNYTTMAGDTWDILALDFYDDESKASLIIQANPQHSHVLVFPAGVQLKVPVIEESALETLPPWKR